MSNKKQKKGDMHTKDENLVLNDKLKIIRNIIGITFIVSLFVHILFKCRSPYSWLEAEWTAGEILTFIASVVTFIGTYLLGLHTAESADKYQSIANKLAEDNNKLQKIIAQNMLPIFNVMDVKTYPANSDSLLINQIRNKMRCFCAGKGYSKDGTCIKLYVNIDVKDGLCLSKCINFSFINISQVPIRHIAFRKIIVNGYDNHCGMIECDNVYSPIAGKFVALSPDQSIWVKTCIYYNDRKYEEAWENNLKGLALTLSIENTSFAGEKFLQNISVCATNEGTWDVNFGDEKSDI